MGMTNFPGEAIKRTGVVVAKDYLNEDELKQLNLVVSQYLDFAGACTHPFGWKDGKLGMESVGADRQK